MSTAFHRRRADHRGFTLVEIMVVVTIIGLLAALAIPAFQRNQRAAQNARAMNDFRIFVQSFEVYNAQNGSWPADAASGVVPTGMTGEFKTADWTLSQNTLGGRWKWDANRAWAKAAVSVTNVTVVDAQLEEMDAKIDDGNLNTGIFRKTATGQVSYILERP